MRPGVGSLATSELDTRQSNHPRSTDVDADAPFGACRLAAGAHVDSCDGVQGN